MRVIELKISLFPGKKLPYMPGSPREFSGL
jgi:hypothetical protein